jgi:hypothetical protein
MDDKEFKLRSEAIAGGVEFVTSCMLAAIEMVEHEEFGTSKDLLNIGIHMALCAQIAKVIARQMTDRNDVDTRKKFIDHTAEQIKEFVGLCFDAMDHINKEIIARNEFSKADPSKVVDDVLAEMKKKQSSNSSTGKIQPKPEQPQKPADPPADPKAGPQYPEEE